MFGNKIQVVVFSYKKNSRQKKIPNQKNEKKAKHCFFMLEINTVLMDTKKIENFTNKKGSHKFVFMLVSTA